ncbi:hypothetical protein [Dactylococcopsis salina]|uniref:hypothetical protein n=1 Tax=Dactylococcopsis salina TaxID=292566 RepID=UPI000312E6FB|nr:hypothetical protein [Dactylococcopsis salina]
MEVTKPNINWSLENKGQNRRWGGGNETQHQLRIERMLGYASANPAYDYTILEK